MTNLGPTATSQSMYIFSVNVYLLVHSHLIHCILFMRGTCALLSERLFHSNVSFIQMYLFQRTLSEKREKTSKFHVRHTSLAVKRNKSHIETKEMKHIETKTHGDRLRGMDVT